MSNLKRVEEGRYPNDLRIAINELIDKSNIQKTIGYGDVLDPQWNYQADNAETIILPGGDAGNIFTVMCINGLPYNVTLKTNGDAPVPVT